MGLTQRLIDEIRIFLNPLLLGVGERSSRTSKNERP